MKDQQQKGEHIQKLLYFEEERQTEYHVGQRYWEGKFALGGENNASLLWMFVNVSNYLLKKKGI